MRVPSSPSEALNPQSKVIEKNLQNILNSINNSDLENEETSLIYCGGILENGQREGRVLGVLGIFFDWENIAGPILDGCLPRIGGEVVEGGASFYVNDENKVIATTDHESFGIGQVVELPDENLNLEAGTNGAHQGRNV